jgi:DNA-binding GntR family transcriptional regulator
MQSDTIDRANLSDSAQAAIRLMIVSGELAAGERVNEVHVAQRLGVSRTPLREALNRLSAEGAVEARPRLGYFIKPLMLEEFEQIYDIRPILDPAALRLAGLRTREQIARLETLNTQLANAQEPMAAIAIDDAWHTVLLEGCPNRVLLELIGNMMGRTRRYEIALMRQSPHVVRASEDHELILRALRQGDLDGACAALKANLESGKAPIAAWLAARESAANSKAKK